VCEGGKRDQTTKGKKKKKKLGRAFWRGPGNNEKRTEKKKTKVGFKKSWMNVAVNEMPNSGHLLTTGHKTKGLSDCRLQKRESPKREGEGKVKKKKALTNERRYIVASPSKDMQIPK